MLALVFFEVVYSSFSLAWEYIHSIADAIREKVAGIVANKIYSSAVWWKSG